jgi:hypothetical protein
MGELHINIGGVLIVVGVVYGFYVLWMSGIMYEHKAFITFLFLIVSGVTIYVTHPNDKGNIITYKGDD